MSDAPLTEHQLTALARLRALPTSALSAKQTKLLEKLASKEAPATSLKRPRDDEAPAAAASIPSSLPKEPPTVAVPPSPAKEAAGFWQQHCEHGRVRSECGQCGGGGLCDHGRKRSKCKQCAAAAATQHVPTTASNAESKPATAALPKAVTAQQTPCPTPKAPKGVQGACGSVPRRGPMGRRRRVGISRRQGAPMQWLLCCIHFHREGAGARA